MKYPADFPLYDHFIHALEYLGYNFDKGPKIDGMNGDRTHTFIASDDEWKISVTARLSKRDSPKSLLDDYLAHVDEACRDLRVALDLLEDCADEDLDGGSQWIVRRRTCDALKKLEAIRG